MKGPPMGISANTPPAPGDWFSHDWRTSRPPVLAWVCNITLLLLYDLKEIRDILLKIIFAECDVGEVTWWSVSGHWLGSWSQWQASAVRHICNTSEQARRTLMWIRPRSSWPLVSIIYASCDIIDSRLLPPSSLIADSSSAAVKLPRTWNLLRILG